MPILLQLHIMKVKQTLRKTRAHMVLFFHNTPFKPKRVELKTRYQRKSKHNKSADFG